MNPPRTMTSFLVYGSPIAQPRVKAQAIVAKNGRAFAHVYEPGNKHSPARQWKSDIKQEGLKHMPAAPWTGPVELWITFFFPRPARLSRQKDPDGPIPHTSKPDRDNCEKAVLDALKGLFFLDDSQVCAGEVRKYYHEKNGHPRAEIEIGELKY